MEDMYCYLDKDPAHLEFKNNLKRFVEKVGCWDYAPGVF